MTGAGAQRYIRTPVELDVAARALERALLRTPSPQKRFLLLTEFHAHTGDLPLRWTSSYLLPLAPTFVELIRMPALGSIPPDTWREACIFLKEIEEGAWVRPGPAIDHAWQSAIEQTIRAHACVSALRELHQFLLDMQWASTPLSPGEWAAVFAASTSAYGLFRAYAAILEGSEARCVPACSRVLRRWLDFRERGQAVSVVLLEADGDERHSAGNVLLMDILPQEGAHGDGNLNNPLGMQGYETVEQLARAQHLAERLVATRFRKEPPHRRYHFSLHETRAALAGGSLGCAAAAGIATSLTRRLNLPQRWTIPTTVSCVGGLTEDGMLEAGTWETVEKKLRVAFHSPLEKLVIPAVHREAALLALQPLQREYPNRGIEVVGITHLADLVDLEGVLGVVIRGRFERARDHVIRHGVWFLLLLVIALFGGGGYFAYRAYYDYPNLEHAMGLQVGTSSIVYNPKDSLTWCFRDERTVLDNRVDFGDIEVGDGFTRTFFVWNMTPSDLSMRVSIEGPDSAEWYLNSGPSVLTVPSAENGLITVMFAPRREGSEKRARLVLRNPRSGEEYSHLSLAGAAGPPLPAGYALRLDGVDDQLHFGSRSTAFDLTATAEKEATFECWIRPTAPVTNAMILHNGQKQGRQPEIEDLFFGFSTSDTLFYRVGSTIGMCVLAGRHVATVGQWMHIALAISIPQQRIAIYVNGDCVSDLREEFLFDGPGTPFVTLGARNPGTTSDMHFAGDIDEVRFWHRFRLAPEIVRDMHRRVPSLTPGLAGYWDMDSMVENTAYNASKRAHSGTLRGRPSQRRSDLRVGAGSADVSIVPGPAGRAAVQLQSGRYLVASTPPLPSRGDATFAFWFVENGRPAVHFNYVLKERGWISVENNKLFTMNTKAHFTLRDGWHLGLCTVTGDGTLRFHLDGSLLASARTTDFGGHDWHARYEGMMLGFRFDKEQQLASKYYDWYHPTLSHPRRYAGLHVWNRILSDTEIQEFYVRNILPTDGLAASWQLDRPPDRDGNFTDAVRGRLLHVKRVRSWE